MHRKTLWIGSLHRQWGRAATIRWLKGLAAFYLDQVGSTLGIGDVSHIVGERMTDHGSHQKGVDVDLYPLGPGSPHRESYWCSGPKDDLLIQQLPVSTTIPKFPFYRERDPQTMSATEQATVKTKHATVIAYCMLTETMVKACAWHGAYAMRDEAARIARAAQSVAKVAWGTGEDWWNKGTINQGFRAILGIGHSRFGPGKGWKNHKDHLHVRLSESAD